MEFTCKLGENGCYSDGKCRCNCDCENRVITNADRIRSSGDDELADILYKFAHSNNKPLNKKNLCEWLKQPAE